MLEFNLWPFQNSPEPIQAIRRCLTNFMNICLFYVQMRNKVFVITIFPNLILKKSRKDFDKCFKIDIQF